MRAVVYDAYGVVPELRDVPVPIPGPRAAVLRVEATGLCRSDWIGWQGHDPDITLPHVPGHELVGHIADVGAEVRKFTVGQRVTTPFVCGCGHCPECVAGEGQVCRNQTQPGFTHDGSFAEYVVVHDADVNLVVVPDDLDAGAAALLGCRFATAYRGLVHRAQLEAGEWVAVFGCGGVGQSAVAIAAAAGARVVGVDVRQSGLDAAVGMGATGAVDSSGLTPDETAARVRSLTDGGAQVTVEALGREETTEAAVLSLRRGGRHVQIGLFAEAPRVPLNVVTTGELKVLGSHGMPASAYPELLDLVTSGQLDPARLVTRRIGLDQAPAALATLPETPGVTLVIPHQ